MGAVVAGLDWLPMTVLLVAGVGVILGIGICNTTATGAFVFVVVWPATSIWPSDNPFMCAFLFYAIAAVGVAAVNGGDTRGLGDRWAKKACPRGVRLAGLGAVTAVLFRRVAEPMEVWRVLTLPSTRRCMFMP